MLNRTFQLIKLISYYQAESLAMRLEFCWLIMFGFNSRIESSICVTYFKTTKHFSLKRETSGLLGAGWENI